MTLRLAVLVVSLPLASRAVADDRPCKTYVMTGGGTSGAAVLAEELGRAGLERATDRSADLRFRVDEDSSAERKGTEPLVSYQGRACLGVSWAIGQFDWGTLIPGTCLATRERFNEPEPAKEAARSRVQREHLRAFRAEVAAALAGALTRYRCPVVVAPKPGPVPADAGGVGRIDPVVTPSGGDWRYWGGAAGGALLAGISVVVVLRKRRGSAVPRLDQPPPVTIDHGPRPEAFIFISYSRQDRASAEALHAALSKKKLPVWFDSEQLTAGDRWKHEIEKSLTDCALFMPLLSAHSLERSEGYFVSEWRAALERRANMKNRAFLIPVVVDSQLADSRIRNDEVASRFLGDAQLVRAPGGRISEADLEQLARLLASSSH